MATGASDRQRVVVTGIGAVTCLGLDVEETWRNLLAGRSGIRRISAFDCTGFEITIAGEIQGFDPVATLGPDWAFIGDRFAQIGLAAALQAVRSAGLDSDRGDLARAAVIMGNAHNDNTHYGRTILEFFSEGRVDLLDRVEVFEAIKAHFQARYAPHPYEQHIFLRQLMDFPTNLVARRFGATGPLYTVSSACVSGAKVVERGMRFLRRGQCEIAVCGGTESVVDPWGIWWLHGMRALTTYAKDPAHASRPFDRDRSGFVLSEGAGVLILETLDHAQRRGAPILAEVLGCGGSANANSLYAPEPVGEGVAGAMQAAIQDAAIDSSEIDLVVAHATATGIGDPAEADGIRIALGEAARRCSITAPKSMLGHAIASAGALGAIQCVQAIRDGAVPPIANLENPDECAEGLRLVRGEAERRPIHCAINNAFGFGGANGSNIFRRFDG